MTAKSGSQVFAKSGVLMHVASHLGNEPPNLTVLESVSCLECGAVYAKPSDGGTVRQNPGCPECGYVGWVKAAMRPLSSALQPRHYGAGPLQHHSC